MKRHVAATVLGLVSLLVIDSHIHWIAHDQGRLMEVSGHVFDVRGWVSAHWQQWQADCASLRRPEVPMPTAAAVLQVIQQHSLPDSQAATLLQIHTQGDWAIAEVAFKTLKPSIVVLRWQAGAWQIQDRAVWSGSTAPWHAPDFVRRYLHRQAPQLPEPLLTCMAIEPSRYGQGEGGLGPVDLNTKDWP